MNVCLGYHWVNVTFVEDGKRYASTGCALCGQLEPGARKQEIPMDDESGLSAMGPEVFFTYAARPIILSGKGPVT